MKEVVIGSITFQVIAGSLEESEADAVVCPANSHGHMRGGVAQALRLAGGDEIELAARALAPVGLGEAVVTTGGRLRARHVIHAPTMRDPVEISSLERIRMATCGALEAAARTGVRVVAFPGMGTGTGEVPAENAGYAMVKEIVRWSASGRSVRVVQLVAFSAELEAAFQVALERIASEIDAAL